MTNENALRTADCFFGTGNLMTHARGRVLLIDDDESIRTGCRQFLESAGYSFASVKNGNRALDKIRRESFDVALLDPGKQDSAGKEILRKIKEESPNMAVIVISAEPDIDKAVEAIKLGAFDYLPKPFAPEVLVDRVGKAAEAVMRALETSCIHRALEKEMLSQVLIGRSEAMSRVVRLIQKAALVDSAVLITGETGSGKEAVARAIHNLSGRSGKRFVAADCGTLTERVFESDLFAPARGALSAAGDKAAGKIELARGGTLFLDEISNLSASRQEELLHAVRASGRARAGRRSKERIDIRIICSTKRDLQQQVRQERFREDLFYGLSVIHIPIPALRERLEDIPRLVRFYLKKLATGTGRQHIAISDEAMRILKICEWPGNVRQLIHAVEFAVEACGGNTIGPEDLPLSILGSPQPPAPVEGSLARLEQNEILSVLNRFQGNKTRAAAYLGINRKTLREKMQRYGISLSS